MKLTTIQAAKQLSVTDRHVRRLINDGTLPAERDGKEWLIEEEAVRLYQDGSTKKIKESLDQMVEFADYMIASPDTIEQLRQRNLPIKSTFVTYDDYLSKLFKEKRDQAEQIIEHLPQLDERIANGVANALYNEFRECYVLGVNGAAIILAIILLEYAMKHKIYEMILETNPDAGWKRVESKDFKWCVEQLKEHGVITENEETDLYDFNTNIRNNYIHYKIRKMISNMYLQELPALNVATGEITIHRDVFVKDMPHLWFSAKKKLDAESVRLISLFCLDWTNKLLTN